MPGVKTGTQARARSGRKFKPLPGNVHGLVRNSNCHPDTVRSEIKAATRTRAREPPKYKARSIPNNARWPQEEKTSTSVAIMLAAWFCSHDVSSCSLPYLSILLPLCCAVFGWILSSRTTGLAFFYASLILSRSLRNLAYTILQKQGKTANCKSRLHVPDWCVSLHLAFNG